MLSRWFLVISTLAIVASSSLAQDVASNSSKPKPCKGKYKALCTCGENTECRNAMCRTCPAGTLGCHDYDGVRGCIDVLSNNKNCGACDNACPQDSPSCTDGKCVCPTGKSQCQWESYCIDLANDPTHCGTCENQCQKGEACVAGSCGSCPTGQQACSTDTQPPTYPCIDILSNHDNCGACGRKCEEGSQCINGDCTCPAGLLACGTDLASCIDPMTNPKFCGSCDVSCGDGNCTQGVCSSCSKAGEVFCNGACRDVSSDESHCGGCYQVCENEGEYCNNGVCDTHTCPSGEAWCGDDDTGKCINWRTDPVNCGGCGTTCGAGQACVEGSCE
ncbi:hypothetical protein CcaverHIS002_0609210 [Cutaneotrichosporon cavernicola]|uniref:TNFR-Cys domain-containing protein n=1 Tax=Cutaneotrichosporon cavernicola TaxID=279322 RepID=A0AA48L9N3_9TREE|nr:uncharacterized protein CcaverHIS019_0608670 [Cutaneotrichosporon cavernicola]BEI86634.1 hypothetical protein CcaverHIS002_0609210 [Cutaneotrichosporon cavernicola]BEI94408.1 hypothetical protein CcaverHIS019_0608670 [Cutaneotrichosporon cavernicola]BEJ02185.1 hypothetical protein CcaverHIS631_0608670 [Cutaneotrichosporon cavernicola]BEJ09946.1 hypothetical protein CcaverHIS641_0608610 [Cutaneotrichosporon cavernicola]